MYFGLRLFGMNVGGLFSPDQQLAPWSWTKVTDLLQHLPVPILILSLAGTAQLVRIMRANLLDELRRPYVVTARARGLPEKRVIMKYPVRAALNPFASTIGYLLPFMVSGSVIISVVLSQRWLGESEQSDKWNPCLRAASVPRSRRGHVETITAQP
jgi:peptide/nickel transport system permease protein